MSIYAATKGAVRTLTRVLVPCHIRMNAVRPGPIETAFFERSGLAQQSVNAFGASVLAALPLDRFGKPDEVGAVAAFLLSENASYVAGAEFAVNGGLALL